MHIVRDPSNETVDDAIDRLAADPISCAFSHNLQRLSEKQREADTQ